MRVNSLPAYTHILFSGHSISKKYILDNGGTLVVSLESFFFMGYLPTTLKIRLVGTVLTTVSFFRGTV